MFSFIIMKKQVVTLALLHYIIARLKETFTGTDIPLPALICQILTHGRGTFRRRNVLYVRASRSSMHGGTIRTRTVSLSRWITACRVCSVRESSCLRTSTTAMRCGWKEKSSLSPSNGKACCKPSDALEPD